MQARNGSLFPSAMFTLYCTYLCYSALVSEPHDYVCNGLGQRINAASATTLATGEPCAPCSCLLDSQDHTSAVSCSKVASWQALCAECLHYYLGFPSSAAMHPGVAQITADCLAGRSVRSASRS